MRWVLTGAAFWVLAALVELYFQWRLLSPPWVEYAGEPIVAAVLGLYAVAGAFVAAAAIFLGLSSRFLWWAALFPPLYLALTGPLLAQGPHLSFRGAMAVGLGIGGAAVASRMLDRRLPSALVWLPLLIVPLPLLLGASSSQGLGGDNDVSRAAHPNLILVTIDTLRPDHLGLGGYERGTSPGLDSLASEGIVFRQAYASMPATAPSMATIMTGLYPSGHGVRRNGWSLTKEVPTLAYHLRHARYATGAAVSVAHLSSAYGWGGGFDWFHDQGTLDRLFPYSGLRLLRILNRFAPLSYACRAATSVDRAVSWLDGVADEPFFLWLHLWDPHYPYAPPETTTARRRGIQSPLRSSGFSYEQISRWVDGYDGEVSYADWELGRLWSWLRARDLADRTVLAVISDHGESIGERSYRGHSILLYEEQISVLFLIVSSLHPEARGMVITKPVSLVDLAPTLFDLLDLPRFDGEMDGVSLMPIIEGDETHDRALFAETDMWGFRGAAVRLGPWKLIERRAVNHHHHGFSSPAEARALVLGSELYDLRNDPGETHNLSDAQPEMAATLQRLLRAHQQESPRAFSSTQLTPAMVRQLRSLGYLE